MPVSWTIKNWEKKTEGPGHSQFFLNVRPRPKSLLSIVVCEAEEPGA